MSEKSSPMFAREAGIVGGRLRSVDSEESLLKPDADPDMVVDRILSLLSAERYQKRASACSGGP